MEKYPEGHFLGIGMAIGIALFSGLGFSLSMTTHTPGLMGIGPAVGIVLGLGIGKGMEEDYRKKGLIRPLTEKEKETRKKAKSMGIVALLAGLVLFAVVVILAIT